MDMDEEAVSAEGLWDLARDGSQVINPAEPKYRVALETVLDVLGRQGGSLTEEWVQICAVAQEPAWNGMSWPEIAEAFQLFDTPHASNLEENPRPRKRQRTENNGNQLRWSREEIPDTPEDSVYAENTSQPSAESDGNWSLAMELLASQGEVETAAMIGGIELEVLQAWWEQIKLWLWHPEEFGGQAAWTQVMLLAGLNPTMSVRDVALTTGVDLEAMNQWAAGLAQAAGVNEETMLRLLIRAGNFEQTAPQSTAEQSTVAENETVDRLSPQQKFFLGAILGDDLSDRVIDVHRHAFPHEPSLDYVKLNEQVKEISHLFGLEGTVDDIYLARRALRSRITAESALSRYAEEAKKFDESTAEKLQSTIDSFLDKEEFFLSALLSGDSPTLVADVYERKFPGKSSSADMVNSFFTRIRKELFEGGKFRKETQKELIRLSSMGLLTLPEDTYTAAKKLPPQVS